MPCAYFLACGLRLRMVCLFFMAGPLPGTASILRYRKKHPTLIVGHLESAGHLFPRPRVPRAGGCCCCCCCHINSHNHVRGHRTGSSHSGAEEYPREKKQTDQRWYTHISQLTQFMPPPATYEVQKMWLPLVRDMHGRG